MRFEGNINELTERLGKITLEGLPGASAQARLAPAGRLPADRIREMSKGKNPRKSAVMALNYLKKGEIFIILIERPEYEGTHSGQIAFPGGKMEESDPDLEFTARRETEEEIGLPFHKASIISALTEVYIPPSNFLVSPFLATLPEYPEYAPDTKEVKNVLEFRVSEFLNSENIHQKSFQTSAGLKVKYPCYVIQNTIIWGATAMILSEIGEIFKRL